MDKILDNQSDDELIKVLLKEIAKSTNEIRCAEADIKKCQSRLGFALMLINVLKDRHDDEKTQQNP